MSPRPCKLTAPTWARTVIPGPRGAPLLYSGTRDGLNSAVLAFEPRQSDLPLQVAFPILLANLTGELLGDVDGADRGRRARARPVQLHIPSGAVGLTVIGAGRDRDAARTELDRRRRYGRHVRRDRPARASTPSPRSPILTRPAATERVRRRHRRRPSPSASAAASPSPALRRAPAAPPLDDPLAPVRFVVDLFDVDESTIAPGIRGGDRGARDGRGRRVTGARSERRAGRRAAAANGPTTRDELWVPIVLLILVALCVEWALLPS